VGVENDRKDARSRSTSVSNTASHWFQASINQEKGKRRRKNGRREMGEREGGMRRDVGK
jgi:hypothetical protein